MFIVSKMANKWRNASLAAKAKAKADGLQIIWRDTSVGNGELRECTERVLEARE